MGFGPRLGPTARKSWLRPGCPSSPKPKHGAEPLPQIRIAWKFRWIRQSRARSRKKETQESYYQRHAVFPDSKKKTLLLATRRLLPIKSPTSAVQWKWTVDFQNKIKWTKYEEKGNFRGWWVFYLGLGPAKENPGCAPAVPRPPQS